jgi:hypothetical protein
MFLAKSIAILSPAITVYHGVKYLTTVSDQPPPEIIKGASSVNDKIIGDH